MSKSMLLSMCRRCQSQFTRPQQRTFGISIRNNAPTPSSAKQPRPNELLTPSAEMQQLAKNAANESRTAPRSGAGPNEPYHLNVYSHKHNTHIVFTAPTRDPILSFSAGNIGLRKASRGTFDAAYQLASYTFRKMAEKNWKVGGKKATGTPMTLNDRDVKNRGIEVILRGYGDGREAFQKATLGAEGRLVKGLIKKVTDGTRLKFGGVRSRAVRRLG